MTLEKPVNKPLTVEDLDADEDALLNADADSEEEDEDGQDTDENEDDQDDDSNEEDDESDEKDHSNPKAEKRIATLTAKMKALEAQNSEMSQEIGFLEKELERKQVRYDNRYPEPLKFNGKPLAELTETEYNQALRNIRSLDGYTAEQKEQILDLAIDQREAGLPLQASKNEILQKQHQKWSGDWNAVESALTDPKLVGEKAAKVFKQNATKIRDHIQGQINEKKFLQKALWEGGVDIKFEHAWKAIKALKLDKEAQLAAYSEDRPGVTSGTGKPGRRTPTSAPGKKTFTRDEINKMSMAEYLKNESAIDEQMAKGLIK